MTSSTTDALISLAALEVACDEGLLVHLARLDEAASRARVPERVVIERVAEALRIHLPLLLERPDALWPALFSHCAFVDSPAARSFGVSAPGPEMPVFSQIGRWLEERRHLHPSTPWLRALTPLTPWGGGLQSALSSPGVLHSIDAQGVVFTEGEAWRRWSPAIGTTATLEVRRLPFSVTERNGATLVTRPDGSQFVPCSPQWSLVRPLQFSADGQLLAFVATNDWTETFVLATATGDLLASFRSSEGPCALSPTGATLAFSTENGLVVRSLRTASRQSQLELANAESIAVNDDGSSVAVARAGSIRLYTPLQGHVREHTPGFAQFASNGSAVSAGWAFSPDGTLKRPVPRQTRWSPSALAPGATRLTANRWCEATPDEAEVLDLTSGFRVALANANATNRDQGAWSGDGLMFARTRAGAEIIELFSLAGSQALDGGGPLVAVALDHTGSQLALLHGDGTVQLQVGGARLRRFPGATQIAFLHHDTALAVGGPMGCSVLRLDGTEQWRMSRPFVASDAESARVEIESGLRGPSVAESLELEPGRGALTARLDGLAAIFPQPPRPWLRSPQGALLAADDLLLKYERT